LDDDYERAGEQRPAGVVPGAGVAENCAGRVRIAPSTAASALATAQCERTLTLGRPRPSEFAWAERLFGSGSIEETNKDG